MTGLVLYRDFRDKFEIIIVLTLAFRRVESNRPAPSRGQTKTRRFGDGFGLSLGGEDGGAGRNRTDDLYNAIVPNSQSDQRHNSPTVVKRKHDDSST